MAESLKPTKSQLVKRFNAIMKHACDMDPVMVLEFCEDVRHALDPIEFAALQDMEQVEVPDASA